MELILKDIDIFTSMSTPNAFVLTDFFPVYDLLYSQVSSAPNKDIQLTESEIRDLIRGISTMDKAGSDMIYVWIRIHSLRHSNSKLLDIPYNGAKVESRMQEDDIVSDVKFDLRSFPPVLNRMLQRFTDLHARKIAEDISRAEAH